MSGKGLLDLDVYVPDIVTPYIRDNPIMPYEIKERGVKKYYGNTINARSKINREYSPQLIKLKENDSDSEYSE